MLTGASGVNGLKYSVSKDGKSLKPSHDPHHLATVTRTYICGREVHT